jgi:hypothetical protein
MSLFCPLCRKEVTSEMITCPWCRHDFSPETFNVLAMRAEVSQKDVPERQNHLRVVRGSKFALSSLK